MASLTCIPKNIAMAFKTRLKSGEITPEQLAAFPSSEARRKYFEKFMDEDMAASVNALYESKTLLKDQQKGLISWLDTVTGMKPERKTALIDRIGRMKEPLLNPESKEAFLEDLAAQKLGFGVTDDEARAISKLSKDYQEKLAAVDRSSPDGSASRIDAGAAQVEFENHMAELKRDSKAITIDDFKNAPLRTAAGKFSDIGGLAKSLKASLDNSFLFRQGFKAMIAHPKEWGKNAAGSFSIIAKQLKNKGTSDDVVNAIKAEIYGRENSLNGKYKKMGLDLGTTEEAYPTSLPEKIPLLGRVYKASEAAFSGTAYRLRADVADNLVKSLEKAGRDTTEKELLKSVGTYTNSLTGRGDLGRAEGFAKAFNNLFFSPRFFKSNLDFLTAHAFDKNMDPALKVKALGNLIKTVALVGTGLGVAKAMNPDSVDFDPTSSDFGKIKVGNTRVDVTAGLGSLVTFLYRNADILARGTTEGRVKLGGKKYDKYNPLGQTVLSFFQNKLSPASRAVVDTAAGQDFDGDKVNLTSVEGLKNLGINLFAPLPAENTVELANDPESIGVILGTMFDGLGIGTNTYGK